VPLTAGTGNITVTAGSGCLWTASSNVSWITVTSGASGTGNGTLNYSVEANAGATRTGTITIGRQIFTVTQSGNNITCSYVVSLSIISTSAGGPGNVSVATDNGCAWTATSDSTWLTVSSGASGTGNGMASYLVAANTGPTPRTGHITIGGRTVTIMQGSQEVNGVGQIITCSEIVGPIAQQYFCRGETSTFPNGGYIGLYLPLYSLTGENEMMYVVTDMSNFAEVARIQNSIMSPGANIWETSSFTTYMYRTSGHYKVDFYNNGTMLRTTTFRVQ
jgi:hypothetical protein